MSWRSGADSGGVMRRALAVEAGEEGEGELGERGRFEDMMLARAGGVRRYVGVANNFCADLS